MSDVVADPSEIADPASLGAGGGAVGADAPAAAAPAGGVVAAPAATPEPVAEVVAVPTEGAETAGELVPEVQAEAPAAPPPSVSPQPALPTIASRLSEAFEKIRFNKRKKLDKIIALAEKKHSIKNDDVEKLLRVSDATASRYLAQLVREGHLRRVGAQKQPTYEPV